LSDVGGPGAGVSIAPTAGAAAPRRPGRARSRPYTQTADLGQPSGIRPRGPSDLRVRTSDIRHPTSDIRPRTS